MEDRCVGFAGLRRRCTAGVGAASETAAVVRAGGTTDSAGVGAGAAAPPFGMSHDSSIVVGVESSGGSSRGWVPDVRGVASQPRLRSQGDDRAVADVEQVTVAGGDTP